MIGIKLQGRLGNQLFQYAFAYAVSKKLKTRFYLDQTEQPFTLHQYFDIGKGFSDYLESFFFSSKITSRYWYGIRINYYKLLTAMLTKGKLVFAPDAAYTTIASQIQGNTLYEGYFQSELFFKDYAATLRKRFRIKSRLRENYENKYAELFKGKEIITVHIRKDDYKNLGHLNLGGDDLSLPLSYYHKLLPQVQSPNSIFVFISDDKKAIEKEFGYLDNAYFPDDDDMINDFQHLVNADICIIANSTFSWWGAWLNEKPGKQVYAPQYFMGHKINKTWPPDIYPASWKVITVNG